MKKPKDVPLDVFEPVTEISPPLGKPEVDEYCNQREEAFLLALNDLDVPASTGPSLPVADDNGSALLFAPFNLRAVMLFPRNNKTRNEFLAVAKATFALDIQQREKEGTHKLPGSFNSVLKKWLREHGGFPTLVKAPNSETLENLAGEKASQAIISGLILDWLMRFSLGGVEASIGRAIFMLQQELSTRKDLSYPRGKGRIREAWAEYKSVAHLWAAFYAWSTEVSLHGAISWEQWPARVRLFCPGVYEGIPGFLALAELYRRFGLASYPRLQKEPFLDLNETWQPPSNLALPNVKLIFPLSDNNWASETYQRYRVHPGE